MVADNERLAVLERDMKYVCGAIDRLEGKVDTALAKKADAEYVESVDARVTELRGWLWGLVVAVCLSMLGTLGAIMLAFARAS